MERWAVPDLPSGAKELGFGWSVEVRNSLVRRVTGSGSRGGRGKRGGGEVSNCSESRLQAMERLAAEGLQNTWRPSTQLETGYRSP